MSDSEDPDIIDRSIEKTHIWLNELAEQLGGRDRRYAYRALRSVLHALRDRLPVEVAAKLASQLPTLIRGVYYEDWIPARTPLTIRHVDEFLQLVAEQGHMAGETEASVAVEAVMRVMRDHVTSGEIDEVVGILPIPLRGLLEA